MRTPFRGWGFAGLVLLAVVAAGCGREEATARAEAPSASVSVNPAPGTQAGARPRLTTADGTMRTVVLAVSGMT